MVQKHQMFTPDVTFFPILIELNFIYSFLPQVGYNSTGSRQCRESWAHGFPGLERATGSRGYLAPTEAWQEKMPWVRSSETLSLPSSSVPPPLPYPGHSSGSYLQTTFMSTHQKRRQGVRKKGERKLRHSVLDAAILKRNAKYLTPSLTCICGMAFCFHHPLWLLGKRHLTEL